MDEAFVKRMKQKLLEMKREIMESLAAEDEEFRNLLETGEYNDVLDIASSDVERRTLDTLGGQEMQRLNLIDAALSRIERGEYGYCLKTGKPIPEPRLEAIPYALYTIEYQKQLERRGR